MPNTAKQAVFISCLAALVLLNIFFAFPPPAALAMGIAIALVTGHPYIHLNKKATTMLLQVSVVCLGFGMNFEHAMKAGKEGFLFTVCTIAVTLVVGYFLGKKLKIDDNTSLLISNGTAICGGSAIAAVAPIVKANDNQISVALGTVFILNSVALFIFPPIGHALGLTAEQFGTWCAIAIHDTSSVVGAASGYRDAAGNDALGIATTIKLERALWIIPIALGTAYFQRSTGKVKIPYFILWFIVAILVSTYLPRLVPALNDTFADKTIFQHLYTLGRKGLVITLFLIGSGLSLKTIRQVGFRPVLQGVILWILIGSISLSVIKGVI
ncbi:putative sulfate exporter family transporter [Nemorincola caseinilytica]|uniref:Sulfate exporter family transporter n=1 Tax=Nemorincola caseinilytica TaxID=2054315 RepID=A0ABP8N1K6_9BACT